MYLSMGDSIADGNDTFAGIVHELSKDQYGEFTNLAIGGSRIPDVFIDQMPEAIRLLMGGEVSLLTLVVGMNDIQGPVSTAAEASDDPSVEGVFDIIAREIDDFPRKYEALVSVLRQVAPNTQMLLLTYYNPYEDDDVMRDVAGYVLGRVNGAIHEIGAKYNALVVDTLDAIGLDGLVGEVLNEETQETHFDVHPNLIGHFNIAVEVLDALAKNAEKEVAA